MRNKTLFILWAALFILCAGLGFIPAPTGVGKWVLVALAAVFFIPGFALVKRADDKKDRRTLALVRNLSILSLSLTLVTLVANILSVLGTETLGNICYSILIIVSAPMVCGQYWFLSLFLWACLMILSISKLRQK